MSIGVTSNGIGTHVRDCDTKLGFYAARALLKQALSTLDTYVQLWNLFRDTMLLLNTLIKIFINNKRHS